MGRTDVLDSYVLDILSILAIAEGTNPEFRYCFVWLSQGDTENDEVFETGFDGARQISYQFVNAPEPVVSLFDNQITHLSCGEEHSAAVTSEFSPIALLSQLQHDRVAELLVYALW